ncbi:MAG: N-acetylmuramoyl-L-alanine amidase [Candidatus Wallbacteria bacterium]|nr:N-acetylmuramoyl-L-alanine amidase [Candidatus Wallbacteria bacterium]
MNKLLTALLLLLPIVCLPAEGMNPITAIDMVVEQGGVDLEDELSWRRCLSELEQPDAGQVKETIASAASEFKVPAMILEAVACVENTWVQIGPSIDRGWGMMHLVENDYCDTLGEAAELLGIDRQTLKDDWRQNIRGAAALLARYSEGRLDVSDISSWIGPLKKLSGLRNEELQEMQALRYFETMARGETVVNLLNQKVAISPERSIDLTRLQSQFKAYSRDSRKTGEVGVDYPGAVKKFTQHNHLKRRIHKIDTWVNHYVGVGTYAGAISWFLNPEAKACAHFVIRNTDGEITQVLPVADTAWHCTRKVKPKGGMNNPRSIGVEHEVNVTRASTWTWNSLPMLKSSAKLAKFFCDKYDIPYTYGCPGIIGHKDMPGCSTDCPGNMPWEKWWNLLTGTTEISHEPAPYTPQWTDATIKSDDVKLRSEPTTESAIVDTLNKGLPVRLVGQYKDWYQVEVPSIGKKGYVFSPLVVF